MKKLGLVCLSLIAGWVYSQTTNTFPTTGPVGIGTTSPSAKMDVNGNMVVDSTLRVKDSIIVEKDMRTKGKFVVEDNSYFQKNVQVNQNVNVTGKIHTDHNLEVANNAKIENNFKVEGNTWLDGNVKMTNLDDIPDLSNPDLKIIILTPNGQLKKLDLNDLILNPPLDPNLCTGGDIANPFWSSGLNKLYSACPQVWVGIGNTAPQHTLDTRGTAYSQNLLVGNINGSKPALINGYVTNSTDDILRIGQKNGAAPEQIRFKMLNDGDVQMTNEGSNTSLTINNGTGHALVINANDGSKILQLEDNGLLRAREIRVDLDTWPDYVFDASYQLMSLTDLKKFIEVNHHLPGFPKAQTIEKKGLNLGQIQKMQMEKIEELTLYTIQLNDEIEALKDENAKLKSQLDELTAEVQEIKESMNK